MGKGEITLNSSCAAVSGPGLKECLNQSNVQGVGLEVHFRYVFFGQVSEESKQVHPRPIFHLSLHSHTMAERKVGGRGGGREEWGWGGGGRRVGWKWVWV